MGREDGRERRPAAGRKATPGVVVGVQGQADLLQVVAAGGPGGGRPDLLDGRQEQADQDGDDGDDHQQLDQGEGSSPAHGVTPGRTSAPSHFFPVYATRQTVPEPSSVTINDPSLATATPTGRPQTLPSLVTKPTRKSSYSPVALPSFIGTRMTL